MEKGLFSVVIPMYNREKTIEGTIESVLNQSYKNFEVIIVDDGSKDSSAKIVQAYLCDERVHYIFQENSGAQVARNKGLLNARGEYIIFLDSDDQLLTNCLEKMVNEYQNDGSLGAVYCLPGILNKKGEIILGRNDHLSGYIYKEVLEQGYLTSSSFISMRSDVFKVISGWDECFPAAQDDDICFQLCKHYKIHLINEILGIYGTGAGNQISSSAIRVANGWWTLWNKYSDEVIINCGQSILDKHYISCAKFFARARNKNMVKECLNRVKEETNIKKFLIYRECCLMIVKKSILHKCETS